MNKRFLIFIVIQNFTIFRDLPTLEVNLNFIILFIALVKFNFNYFVIFEFQFFNLKSSFQITQIYFEFPEFHYLFEAIIFEVCQHKMFLITVFTTQPPTTSL